MRRSACVALGVVLVAGVTSGCTASSADEFSEVEVRALSAETYGVRLGEVVETGPGLASADVWLPSVSGGGVYFKVVSIEGNSPFPHTLCEGAALFWGETRLDGSESCSFSVAMKDSLREGMLLHLEDVPANSSAHYEVEVRALGDGTAHQPELRTVFMIGNLIPSGVAR